MFVRDVGYDFKGVALMTVFPRNFLTNINKKRFNLRITTNCFTYFSMLARSQRIEGITSRVYDQNGKPTNNHYIFWDLEGKNIEETKKTLKKVQNRHNLSNIYLTSDNNGKTYRGWCFSIVTFETFLKILIDSLNVMDYGFFYYTVKRQEATLRLNQKEGRPFQTCTDVIESFSVPFPTGIMKRVVYHTGNEKKGTTINLGVD
jgi:hypothetical protein